MVRLGEKVRDKITGLTGIVMGRTEWMHGCIRLSIQPQEIKDGKPVDMVCLDEPQVEVIAERDYSPSPTTGPGGPRDDAPRGHVATR